ncbi:MAG: hypothetical protein J7L42_01215, partial [Elusimicrobia bacterium]|nr:hypothetical protein [Elusimicrobiota bacterium]
MKKILFLVCFVFMSGFAYAGNHKGEAKQLDVRIEFSGSYGTTITNSEGIFYHFWGYCFKEDKIYPPKYWGAFPLYFFGTKVPVKVIVKNNGPRAKAKIRVKVEAYCLLTDGSNGTSLMEPKTIEVVVAKGEQRIIDASFVAQYVEGADSGLDRFIVKVLHINEGGGKGNPEPALVMS